MRSALSSRTAHGQQKDRRPTGRRADGHTARRRTRGFRCGRRAAGRCDGVENRKGYDGRASLNHPRGGTASRTGTAASHLPRAGTPGCRRHVPRARSSDDRLTGERYRPHCTRRENKTDWLTDGLATARSSSPCQYGQDTPGVCQFMACAAPLIALMFCGEKNCAGEIVPAFIWTNPSMAS